jgi:DNA-binding FadR family transcriptional regulator
LSTERELAEQLRVARISVLGAIKILQRHGYVRVAEGRQVFGSISL